MISVDYLHITTQTSSELLELLNQQNFFDPCVYIMETETNKYTYGHVFAHLAVIPCFAD